MNKASKTTTKNSRNTKSANKDKEKDKKKKLAAEKNKKQENDYKRLEEYLNESGLSLAFNIIFAELVSKQILPENFFTYTAMRLTQIGKEIEGLKTKDVIYVDEEQKSDEQNNDNQSGEGEQPPQEENKEENKEVLFMTRPEQPQTQATQTSKNTKNKK